MAIETAAGATRGSPALTASNKHAISFAILKEYYTDGVRDLLNSSTVLLKYMNRSSKVEVSGQYAVVPIRISRNEGHGHVREGGNLPDPGKQGFERATYTTHNFYARIKFSGPSAAATRNRRGSYLEIIDTEVTGIVQDASRDLNRIAFGDGSGRLATFTPNGTTTVTVANPGGITNTGNGTQFLRAGMRVAAVVPGSWDGSVITSDVRTITAVDPAASTITLSSSIAAGAERALVRVSTTTSTSPDDMAWMNEPHGLASIISDANPYNAGTGAQPVRYLGQIDRTTVLPWRSVVVDNGGTPIAIVPSMLQRLQDEMEKSSSAAPSAYLTTHGLRLAIFEYLQASRRYPNTMKFDGGFETLAYNNLPIVPDRDCTKGRVYAVNFDHVEQYYEEDFHWMDKDGSFLSRMANQDAYQACLVRYHQFGTDMPNALGLLTDLEDS